MNNEAFGRSGVARRGPLGSTSFHLAVVLAHNLKKEKICTDCK